MSDYLMVEMMVMKMDLQRVQGLAGEMVLRSVGQMAVWMAVVMAALMETVMAETKEILKAE